MKPVCLLPLLILSVFLRAQSDGKVNLRDEKDRKTGHWILHGKDDPTAGVDPEGKVSEGDYINDRKEGIWTKYYPDGKTPRIMGAYRNNRPAGRYWKFWENGQLKESGLWEKNSNIDTTRNYTFKGCLVEEHAARFDRYRDSTEHIIVTILKDQEKPQFLDADNQPLTHPVSVYDCNNYKTVIHPTNPPFVCGYPASPPRKNITALSGSAPPTISDSANVVKLGSCKNCYLKIYNTDKEIWQDGIFENGKLKEGKAYFYDRDGILERVLIYKNGVCVDEGQL